MKRLLKTGTLQVSKLLTTSKKPFVGVLMYHSVDETNWKYGVSEKDLKRQLKYIKENYDCITTEEVIEYIKGNKEIKRDSVAITIDDGYENTYTKFFPLLKKYNLPATLFLTTNLSEMGCLGDLKRPTWEQLKEMERSGIVAIEAHGHNHKNLVRALENREELKAELETCKKEIKENLGKDTNLLAYAAGHKNNEVIEEVKSLGFTAGFDISEGSIEKGDNLFRIKRIQVDRTMSFTQFKLRLTGAIDTNRKIVDALRIWKK